MRQADYEVEVKYVKLRPHPFLSNEHNLWSLQVLIGSDRIDLLINHCQSNRISRLPKYCVRRMQAITGAVLN